MNSEIATIELNKKFPLFEQNRIREGFNESSRVKTFECEIFLETDLISKFPLNIRAFPVNGINYGGDEFTVTSEDILTPFHPEQGYKISPEDFKAETRARKISNFRKEARRNGTELLFHSTDPLMIGIDRPSYELRNCNLYVDETPNSFPTRFKEDVLQVLSNLELVLHFPDSQELVSRTRRTSLMCGEILFHEFVPIDIPPLPVCSGARSSGFFVYVPSDYKTILQVDGNFILANQM